MAISPQSAYLNEMSSSQDAFLTDPFPVCSANDNYSRRYGAKLSSLILVPFKSIGNSTAKCIFQWNVFITRRLLNRSLPVRRGSDTYIRRYELNSVLSYWFLLNLLAISPQNSYFNEMSSSQDAYWTDPFPVSSANDNDCRGYELNSVLSYWFLLNLLAISPQNAYFNEMSSSQDAYLTDPFSVSSANDNYSGGYGAKLSSLILVPF